MVEGGCAPEDVWPAISRLDRETAIGPMLDPSAYLDGRRFKNADDFEKVLRAALTLRSALPETEVG